MRILDKPELEKRLPWNALIDAIAEALREGKVQSPQRQVLPITMPDGHTANLLLMPAWVSGEAIGVKAVTYFPQNPEKGLSSINAAYLLFDGATGQLKAVAEGDALTERRTAAASALGARYLVRPDARRLLIVGTGQLSIPVAEAHAAVRNYAEIAVWGRKPEKARAVADALKAAGLPATTADNLEAAVRAADTISCVTNTTEPLIMGAWLSPGSHLDLIGAFRGDMRESDDEAVRKADIFVDTREGATLAGDLAQPLDAGVIGLHDIRADLAELATGAHPGRTDDEAVTLFKSAGFALEDLAAARLAAG